jgi:predicted ester cyclase
MEPKQVAELLLSAFNRKDLVALRELYDPRCQIIWPGRQADVSRDLVLDIHRIIFEGFPDARLTPFNIVAAGETVVAEVTFWGTQTGTMRFPRGDLAPTGKIAAYDECTVVKVRSDRVVFQRYYTDRLDLLLQLGVVPPPIWSAPDAPPWGRATSPSGSPP